MLSFDFMKFVVLSDKLSCAYISRVPDQNGVSLLYIMLEIHHSGREPSISRVPDQNGLSLLYAIFEIHHSGGEPSIYAV